MTAAAQTTRDARAIVTIVDMTGAILPGATVTITPRELPGAQAMVVTATDAGVATVPGLKPGRYTIKAEFPGFDAIELADVRLRAGDNKQQIELELTGFTDTVEVGQDPQAAASNPNNTLATELTADEIENLSDDPNEMMRQLVEMAGGAARVRIDGFNGGSLPSRDVIRSVRIVRDTFPAENHSAENDGIDIITQAGIGPIRGGFSTRVRDSVFSGDNPFVDVKAPERTQNFDANLGGAIKPNKSSFSMFFSGRKAFDTPVATYVTLERQDVDAARPAAERRLECERDVRLQPEQESRAARRLLAELHDAQQSRHRRIRPRRARLFEREQRQPGAGPGDRADRHEHVPEHAAAAAPVSQRIARRSSKRRPSACSTASRAAARRSPAASTRRTSSWRRT